MYWTLPPSIMIRTLWGTISVKRGVARKSCIFTKKMSILLILNTYTLHRYLCILQVLRQKYFISNVLGLASLNQDQNSMGYCLKKNRCCQKIMPFYLKWQCCLGPIAKYMHLERNHPYFMSLMTNIFHFFMFWMSPSIMIRKPYGIGSVNGGVARKSCLFT